MVWRESDDAISDVLRCNSPRLAGDLDNPQRVDAWWAERNVPITSALLGRQDLFHLASEARESGDLLPLLWHVLAWGAMGDLRNAPTVVRSAENSVGRSRLNDILRAAAAASYRGDIETAYRAIHKKIPRFGPAFFTKFLYFTGNRASPNPRCMILDSRVTAAAFTLTGTDYSDNKPAAYARFCGDLHRWANNYGKEPDAIEFRLYKFGQLIDSRRWRWLHAEACLYRAGATDVGFDDVVHAVARGRP